MNAHFKCSSSDLEIQYDSSRDDYQIECEKDMGEFTQAVRANLTPQEDGSYTLGVNMDFDADHTDLSFVLNPETLSIEKMTKADY